MQFCQVRKSGCDSALIPIDPTKPSNPDGTGSGNLVSPRCATKIRFGDSAKTPEFPPNANPSSANGFAQPSTASYGLAIL